MDELDAIRVTFFQECDDLLGELEAGLLSMQRSVASAETVNSVFRAVHSIKGGASVFGLEALVRFSHLFEAVLEGVRSDRLAATPDLISLLLSAHDELIDHIGAARAGRDDQRRSTNVSVRLGQIVESLNQDPTDFHGFTPVATTFVPFEPPPSTEGGAPQAQPPPPPVSGWSITFRPFAELYRKANEPAVLLRELARLGQIDVQLDLADLPPLTELDPEDGYLGWTIALAGDADRDQVAEVFEFVEGDCDLAILAPGEQGACPAPSVRACEIAKEADPAPTFTQVEPGVPEFFESPAPLAAADTPTQPTFEDAPVLENIPAALQSEREREPAQSPQRPDLEPPPADTVAPSQAVIRVDPEKIDRLIDLVGELVISQVMLAQKVQDAGLAASSELVTGLEDLEQLTREIQDGVMAVRAQPVRTVFQRMPRLVREIAALTGKQVRLVTEGEATEVDRSVIERLADPLTHMIRNAIDHGLETPQDRIRKGKAPEGLIRLTAKHRGARIVIELSDDGGGIDREKVLRAARTRGLIAPDAVLDDETIDSLIFLPGFSTAASVSQISGRGVGMDVVRRSVQALGGRISITSIPGQGATVALSLPLTLAVLDGMQVDVCGHTLIAPLAAIIESVRPRPQDVRQIGSGAVLAVRDRFLPMIDIGVALGFRPAPINPADGIVLLVETDDGGRVALVADDIHGQRQVVIKSLESNYGHVAGISAATIMGDGRVALIVDIDAVIAMRAPPSPSTLLAAE